MPTVAERLGDVDAADLIGARKVRDGSRNTKNAMEAACRQAHCGCSVGKQLASCVVRRRDLIEKLTIRLGVRARSMAIVAVGLDLPGNGDTRRDFGASFRGRR